MQVYYSIKPSFDVFAPSSFRFEGFDSFWDQESEEKTS